MYICLDVRKLSVKMSIHYKHNLTHNDYMISKSKLIFNEKHVKQIFVEYIRCLNGSFETKKKKVNFPMRTIVIVTFQRFAILGQLYIHEC